jgi:hypothetical protein
MTPADQEFIHDPENGQYGDCQRAVVASLLDLPITAVPHFLREAAGEPVAYWERLQAFVRSHGFVYLNVPVRAGQAFYGDDGDVFHEISGPSPRGNGVGHAVVGCNGQIVFDPHPSRAGLAGDPATWEHSYMVRVDAITHRELGMLQAENAGLEAANFHLSRMVDELQSGPVFGIIDPDYAAAFTKARIAAWQHGYAITLHGSFTRDLDLVAVPWTDRACDAETLVAALEYRTGLKRQGPPSDKPHGRKAVSLLFPAFEDPRWIDLSILPRLPSQEVATA